jgi:hypothetical protein
MYSLVPDDNRLVLLLPAARWEVQSRSCYTGNRRVSGEPQEVDSACGECADRADSRRDGHTATSRTVSGAGAVRMTTEVDEKSVLRWNSAFITEPGRPGEAAARPAAVAHPQNERNSGQLVLARLAPNRPHAIVLVPGSILVESGRSESRA